MRVIKYPCTLQVYRFEGNKAMPDSATVFVEGTPKATMLDRLAQVRAALPQGFGAGLLDARGYNVYPRPIK